MIGPAVIRRRNIIAGSEEFSNFAIISFPIPSSLALSLMALWLLIPLSCGDTRADFLADGPEVTVGNQGKVVGGPCTDRTSCAAGSLCLKDDSFPGGICTKACSINEPCPASAVCVAEKDGVCLVTCTLPQTCRTGYTCKKETLFGAQEEKLVCSGENE